MDKYNIDIYMADEINKLAYVNGVLNLFRNSVFN